MKLIQLQYFKTVAEIGKISQAAKVLYISAPALSNTISGLEKELGVPLFKRESNSIELNEQGAIFLRYVNQIFNNLDCAKLEIQRSLQENHNTIHIAVTSSSPWMPLVSAFSSEYPDIMLSFSTLKLPHLMDHNLSQQYSFILAEHNDFSPSDLNSIHLYDEHPIAMVPTTHAFSEREDIHLSELADEILFLPPPGQSMNKRIKQLFSDNQIPLKHVHECSDTTCKTMVSEGRGIFITTSDTARSNQYSLCRVPVKAAFYHWEQRLYWKRDRMLTKEEILFKDFIQDMYQDTGPHNDP